MQLRTDSVEHRLSPGAVKLGKDVLSILQQFYPAMSPGWSVAINERGGLVQVTNTLLSGKMGFILHINQIDPEMKSVMRAGGELLERYQIARDRVINVDNVAADLANRSSDAAGNLQADM